MHSALRSKLVPAIVMVIALVAFGTLSYYSFFQKSQNADIHKPRVHVPATVRQAAENLIVKNVGHEYFVANYSPHQSKDYVSLDKTEYILEYDYLAGRAVGIETPVGTSVSYYPEKNFGRLNGIFNCVEQPGLCEFTITRAEALTIAEANGLNSGNVDNTPPIVSLSSFAPDKSIFESDGWYIVVSKSLTSQDDCYRSNTVTIRERDGKVFTELNKVWGCV